MVIYFSRFSQYCKYKIENFSENEHRKNLKIVFFIDFRNLWKNNFQIFAMFIFWEIVNFVINSNEWPKMVNFCEKLFGYFWSYILVNFLSILSTKSTIYQNINIGKIEKKNVFIGFRTQCIFRTRFFLPGSIRWKSCRDTSFLPLSLTPDN